MGLLQERFADGFLGEEEFLQYQRVRYIFFLSSVILDSVAERSDSNELTELKEFLEPVKVNLLLDFRLLQRDLLESC